MFKYFEAHYIESETTIILKLSPNEEIKFYLESEEVEKGKEAIAKLKLINNVLDEIIACEKRTEIENFIIVPIS
ncbi:MAG: hypothetical protein FWH29_02740 [Methanobrevibacter sp.]|nr:hypothetical protein [Methanobrevibacter sp.]